MDVLVYIFIGYLVYRFLFKKKDDKNSQRTVATSKPKSQSVRQGLSVNVKTSSISSSSSDDDELATFTISYGYEEEESNNKTPARWIKSGDKIVIAGVEITGGNFYFGGKLKAFSQEDSYYMRNSTEASLIDNSLKIQLEDHSFTDESLNYWPKFISISPRCRGAYINWLASERNTPETPLGYVFIYFYGLERRIVVEAVKGNVSKTEYQDIFAEVTRLRSIYGSSRSFRNYSYRLLEFMCIHEPDLVSMDSELQASPDSLLFRVNLARTVLEGSEIPAELALEWIRNTQEYSLRTPARRCSLEFAELFKAKYIEKFGEGILVKPNKTKLRIGYHSASSTLSGISLDKEDLPDPSILKGPVKKLIVIADQCTDALEGYSRYLGKKDTDKNDIAAILLLPDELINDVNCPQLIGLREWAEDVIQNHKGIVEFKDFWKHTENSLPEKINKKEVELIQSLTDKAGFGMAPDNRYHHAKPSVDGKIVLFHDGHGEYFQPSSMFNETGMVLRLGSMVAAIDSNIDDREVEILHNLIDHDTKLSPVEKRSLHAYLNWRLNSPSNMTGLKARLEKLASNEKASISRILVSVALADGTIDPREIKQLEKLYTVLGLNKAMVTSDIHSITSAPVQQPKSPADKVEKYETAGFKLDDEILSIHQAATNDVQNMLGAIFSEDEESEHEPLEVAVQSNAIEGLDDKHLELFAYLKVKEKWPRSEVAEFCQSLGLMVDGALEAINDWSFDKVDAPVFDDDDDIYVDQEIVLELEG
ncbi:tellurite resistance TerB family protein [Aliamphritea hakodatensis]|uniref:tellurite resistance TerB family protein n=1 Tax=Aliamphritea hakodatensis TaxID=2895352 RepID=UPI0022FD9D6F|nr:TerB N-terminal domain-containing protein [Aliamphritea hakodatensis]